MPLDILSIQPHNIRGGPALQHLDFLRQLRVHDIQSHVVIPPAHELEAEYRDVSASVLELAELKTIPRTKSALKLAGHLVDTAMAAQKIFRYAKRTNASVVHTFNEAVLSAPWAAKAARLPSVIQIIGMSVFEPAAMGYVYSQLLRFNADALVCCQSIIRDKLIKAGASASATHVVYNSVDIAALEKRAEAAVIESTPGQLRIGMIAGLDRRKGHVMLVRAAAKVCAALPEAQVFVVGKLFGDDEYLAEIRGEIQNANLESRVQLVGPVDNSAAWIKSFDIYCIPSLSEALTVAGIEAMSLKKPVVATSVGGNVEAILDGVTGVLCAPGDPGALAGALLRLAEAPEKRSAMGSAGYERAHELFSLEENGARLATILKGLAAP